MKCGYKYCKDTTELDKEIAIKENGKYYHFGCYEKKEVKKKIADLFFKYVKNDEEGFFIKKIISNYVDKDDISADYVYFALCYAVKENIPLRSIFGLKYIMNNNKVKEKYQKLLDDYKNVTIRVENLDYIYRKELPGGWDDMIG